MKDLLQDIKTKTFKKVYLFYGEENFLIRSYKTRFKEAVIGVDTMNYQYFEGKDLDISTLTESAETLPFLAERRLIIIEDSGLLKKDSGKLPDYLETMPESTCLLFIEYSWDKRNRLFKKISKLGRSVEFNRLTESELKRWVIGVLNKEGKKIRTSTMELLLSMEGDDMDHLRQELDKLLSYVGEKEEITENDLKAVLSGQVTGKIFDMVRAISLGKKQEALNLYYDLLTLREPPLRILFLIARQFNQLLQVKELSQKHLDDAAIAKKTGVKPFALKYLKQQSSRFTLLILKQCVSACVEMEEAVKKGNMKDSLAVEMLIVHLL